MEGSEFSYEEESNDDTSAMLLTKPRFCFCIPCFGNRSPSPPFYWWQRIRTIDHTENKSSSLWSRGIGVLKKLREWSEIVAGPKWKTFIRQFNRNKIGNRNTKLIQYDPMSYALNFDEGKNGNYDEVDDDHAFRNFSSRYASIPTSSKTSMDFGKAGPSFA